MVINSLINIWMRIFFLIFTAIVLMTYAFGCKKSETESINEQLKGQWVRTDIKSDTLVFGYLSLPWVEIRRGYEIINGSNTQKVYGWFDYRITNDSISLTGIASSNWSEKWYLFKINASRMNIEDFIDSTNTILTFEKIK